MHQKPLISAKGFRCLTNTTKERGWRALWPGARGSERNKILQTQISAEICTHQQGPRRQVERNSDSDHETRAHFHVQCQFQTQAPSSKSQFRATKSGQTIDDRRWLCKMILRFNLLLSLCTSFHAACLGSHFYLPHVSIGAGPLAEPPWAVRVVSIVPATHCWGLQWILMNSVGS